MVGLLHFPTALHLSLAASQGSHLCPTGSEPIEMHVIQVPPWQSGGFSFPSPPPPHLLWPGFHLQLHLQITGINCNEASALSWMGSGRPADYPWIGTIYLNGRKALGRGPEYSQEFSLSSPKKVTRNPRMQEPPGTRALQEAMLWENCEDLVSE